MSSISSQPPPDKSAGDQTGTPQPTVLIVDDEPLNRFLIAEALAADNYRIVDIDSGEAAVDYLAHNDADLILLDIDMPGMSGLAACKAIRALPNGNLVPIAIVTGLDDNASIEHAFDCGATDFLTKPVNWTLMRQRVRFMLRHSDITRDLRHNELILQQVNETAQIGHSQWDIANHVATHSELFSRIVPGIPRQVTGITLGSRPGTEFGQAVFARMFAAIQAQQVSFEQELSLDLPGRGLRYLLNHGRIDYRDGKPVYAIFTVQDITERHRNEERYAAIFEASPVGITEADCSRLLAITQKADFVKASDAQLREELAAQLERDQRPFLIKANPAARRMFPLNGAAPFWLRELRKEIAAKFLFGVRDNQSELVMRCEIPQPDGEPRHAIINFRLPRTLEEYQRVVITFSDITDIVTREAQLKRADAIIANSRDAVSITDKNSRIVSINPAFTRITGYTLEQRNAVGVITRLIGSDCDQTKDVIRDAIRQQDYWRGEVEFLHREGAWKPAMMQVQLIRNEAGEADGYVSIISDISDIKESERRLFHLAHFDALTGLPNRLSLQERLQAEFTHTGKSRRFCLLYIDLDGFKLVNDSMGHPTGDALLKELSVRFSAICRAGDLLARIGGDEFALLMLEDATNRDIDVQAAQIFSALAAPFAIKGREIFIGASIGACRYPDDAANAEEMLRNADSAMYEAKRLGRGQLCYYSIELTNASNHRLQIENELRVAITSDQLFLLYQPKFDASSGAIVGAEALVRWRSPTRGVVSPAEFIGIAEASGLIIPLGEWVINESCRQLAAWQRECGLATPVAINISALHLRDDGLLQVLSDAFARHDIDPRLIEIEITEDSLDFRSGDDKPYIMLNRLSKLGLSIAIDDFGTGYSSLSQLKKMPISTLKIDRSFVRDIVTDESDLAIITAIVGLAKTLDMKIVAEGVETEAQAHRLRLLQCHFLQGFLYSIPLPPEELLKKLLVQHDADSQSQQQFF